MHLRVFLEAAPGTKPPRRWTPKAPSKSYAARKPRALPPGGGGETCSWRLPPSLDRVVGQSSTQAAARGRGGSAVASIASGQHSRAGSRKRLQHRHAQPIAGPERLEGLGRQLSQLGDEKPGDTPIIRAALDSGQVGDPAPLSPSQGSL